MQHAVRGVYGVGVRGLANVLDATSLINCAVDDDRARPHRRDNFLGHQHRRAAARYQDRADDEIGVGQDPGDRRTGARDRDDATAVYLIDPPKPLDVLVEHQDFGFHSLRDPRRAPADRSRTQHDDTRGSHAGRTPEQDAAPALATLEEMGADLRRHAAGHFAHRNQEWKVPVGELHRLVADAGRARVEQRARDLGVGREVEVREEHETGPQVAEFARLRLLHLEDEAGPLPHGVGTRHDLGAGSPVVVVGDPGIRAAVLVGLDLARNADDEHGPSVTGKGRWSRSGRTVASPPGSDRL